MKRTAQVIHMTSLLLFGAIPFLYRLKIFRYLIKKRMICSIGHTQSRPIEINGLSPSMNNIGYHLECITL